MSADVASGLLSFEQAAEKIGWTGKGRGRRLKRACFAKQRLTKKQIVTQMGTAKKPAYKVTLGALRRAFPEMFGSKVDVLEANFRTYLSTINAKIRSEAAAYVAEHVEPRLEELWQRDETVAKQVDALGSAVAQLASKIR